MRLTGEQMTRIRIVCNSHMAIIREDKSTKLITIKLCHICKCTSVQTAPCMITAIVCSMATRMLQLLSLMHNRLLNVTDCYTIHLNTDLMYGTEDMVSVGNDGIAPLCASFVVQLYSGRKIRTVYYFAMKDNL